MSETTGDDRHLPPAPTGAAAVHLTGVWFVGCVLTAVHFQAALLTLFAGGWGVFAVVPVVVVPPAVALLAVLGRTARLLVPLVRRRRGTWRWAAVVYGLGTAGAAGAVAADLSTGGRGGPLVFAAGGACYALAAASLLPGARARAATLGAAVLLVAAGAYAVWDASRPPTLDAWLTAHRVDRELLRVGDAPRGHALQVLGASGDGFGVAYERPGSPGLHLAVARAGADTGRVDARGCPVPYGGTVRCSDDAGGRLLVTYEDGDARRELRLERDGLAYTVTLRGADGDLAGARHVLSTLRPATAAELAPLREFAMPR
ncbi:hypothetical protein [Streptomyces sp. DH12]|uniref:hypothetical protein n=1 Tax=Streptomyces sp. DH12 TaxID=2857010 RepID=UPI001E56501D|nr:hypothetical protein [Streptomyces sp. DH12]